MPKNRFPKRKTHFYRPNVGLSVGFGITLMLNAFTETIKKYTPARVDAAYRQLTTGFGLDGQPAQLWNR